jgi:hypothetical protein
MEITIMNSTSIIILQITSIFNILSYTSCDLIMYSIQFSIASSLLFDKSLFTELY